MYFRERSILHLNVADFSVAVERVADTTLRDKPLIIAPLGSSRAVVYDMSEESYQDGIRKGMQLKKAVKICPRAILLPPRLSLYQRAMQEVVKKAYQVTPLVEYGREDGHLYLDVTGTHRLQGPPPDVGLRLQREMDISLRLQPIWSYAANKLVAKVASRLVKPIGEYIVAPGEEKPFLAPLPLSILPGLEVKEQNKLREFNLTSIGQVAALNLEQLMIPFGARSQHIYELCHGIDSSRVTAGSTVDTPLSCEYTFADDSNDIRLLEGLAAFLAARLGKQLRRRKRKARRVGIRITYTDGTCCSRQATTKQATSNDTVLGSLAVLVLQRAKKRRTRVRSCCLSCDRFQPDSPQLDLFQPRVQQQEQEKIAKAIDAIKEKYGEKAVLTGMQHRFNEQDLVG